MAGDLKTLKNGGIYTVLVADTGPNEAPPRDYVFNDPAPGPLAWLRD
jgi:hypothetical protein